jgi:putative glutamine amidotransferase
MEFSIPWIGLPAQMNPGEDRQYLDRHYTDAILACGGMPIILPLLEKPESLLPLVGKLDGILLTGSSSDVAPEHYSAMRESCCGPVQPLRDKTDFALLEVALQQHIPVLAICFGLQSLNVFSGGSLVQDIPSRIRTSLRHSRPGTGGRPAHTIEIRRGSILEVLAGVTSIRVNSTHHQAIDRPGQGLEVIARAPDGVIEAVVASEDSQHILGVQWHPEKSFSRDEFSRRIFEWFIANCKFRRGTNERIDPKVAQGTRGGSWPGRPEGDPGTRR